MVDIRKDDEVRFRYLPLTAPEKIVRGIVVVSPWQDDDGVWLDIRDEFGIVRTARLEEVVDSDTSAAAL